MLRLRLRSALGWGRDPEALLVPASGLVFSLFWVVIMLMLPAIKVYIYTNRFPLDATYWRYLWGSSWLILLIIPWFPGFLLYRNAVGSISKRSPVRQTTGQFQQLLHALPRDIYVQIGYPAAECQWFCLPAEVEVIFADASPSDLFEFLVVSGNGYVRQLKQLGKNTLTLSFDPPMVADDATSFFDDDEDTIEKPLQPTRAEQKKLVEDAKRYPKIWGGSPTSYRNAATGMLIFGFLIWGFGAFITWNLRVLFHLPDGILFIAIIDGVLLCCGIACISSSRHYMVRFQRRQLLPDDTSQFIEGIITNWALNSKGENAGWLFTVAQEDGKEALFCAGAKYEKRVQAIDSRVRVTYIPRTGLVLNVLPLDLSESLRS